jgi:hypothetical protein
MVKVLRQLWKISFTFSIVIQFDQQNQSFIQIQVAILHNKHWTS